MPNPLLPDQIKEQGKKKRLNREESNYRNLIKRDKERGGGGKREVLQTAVRSTRS